MNDKNSTQEKQPKQSTAWDNAKSNFGGISRTIRLGASVHKG